MSQLRRPFGAVQERYGKAGLIISILALVMALGGGAYAASGGLTAKEKKEVKAIAKGKQGPRGKTGATGPAGPAGPQGPAGAAGAKGDKGDKGDTGNTGAQGAQGNPGPKGDKGDPGDPWTVGGTLPSEASLTGAWSFGNLPEASTPAKQNSKGLFLPISFALPLETELGEDEVHFINTAGERVVVEENIGSGELERKSAAQASPKPCPGTVANPEAEPGNLCVYEGKLEGPAMASNLIGSPASEFLWPLPEFNNGTSTSGAILNAVQLNNPEPQNYGWGTWVVTAP